jgi:large subunit ribosomal protein L9
MEIILLEHVENLGLVGQTVKVKDGYARNFLLPKKLACVATKQNLNYYKTLIERRQKKLAREKEAADIQAQQLGALTLTFLRKSRDEEARLFGSVTQADVAQALSEKGYDIDKRRIALSEPIKRLGEYKAIIKLHPQVQAQVTLQVCSDSPETDDDRR